MSGRRFDVSATQIVASMLAAVTGAVAASYLSVAGTLIGAAIASVASTAGAAVYQHYLARSHERLRKAAVVLAPRAGLGGIARHPAQQQRPAQERPTEALHGLRRRPGSDLAWDSAGAAGTAWDSAAMAWTARDSETAHRTAGRAGTAQDFAGTAATAGRAGTAQDFAGTAATAGRAGTAQDFAGRAGKSADPARTAGAGRGRRPWLVLAGVALAVFLFAMGGITAFELVAGKPISSALFHHSGSGTTIGHLVGGHSRRLSAPNSPRPTTPAPTSRATASPSPSPSPSPTPSVSPSPSPTSSPAPSSTPPALGSASPSPAAPAG